MKMKKILVVSILSLSMSTFAQQYYHGGEKTNENTEYGNLKHYDEGCSEEECLCLNDEDGYYSTEKINSNTDEPCTKLENGQSHIHTYSDAHEEVIVKMGAKNISLGYWCEGEKVKSKKVDIKVEQKANNFQNSQQETDFEGERSFHLDIPDQIKENE